jgi:hypothetical protein
LEYAANMQKQQTVREWFANGALILLALIVCCIDPSVAGNGTIVHAHSGAAQVLVGAGDIADCSDLSGARATAKLLASLPGTVFVLGDLAYGDGTSTELMRCYDETWGQYKQRTRPAPGNHEYETKDAPVDALGYFQYFNGVAGPAGEGYYSYELGAWHIIVLNSNCSEVKGGCNTGSPEERWLRSDLAAHPSLCQLAYFHHPLFSSSLPEPDKELEPMWMDLYQAGVDLVVNGHAHNYERFAPQDPSGHSDPARGIRELIAGTGGKDHAQFLGVSPNSEVRNNDSFGVLKLTLYPRRYRWKFIPVSGAHFTDAGGGSCHAAPGIGSFGEKRDELR